MKRREFLKIAGTGAAGLAVGAAAGYVGMKPLEAEIARLKEPLLEDELWPLEDSLNVFNWTYYLNRPRVERWCRDHGIALSYDNYESSDELIGVLEAAYPGASGYDICVMTDGDIPYSIEHGLFELIDLDKIPNFEFVPTEFRGFDYDPENRYTIIYSYGTTGLGWNSEKVTPAVTKWADVFDTTPGGILDRYGGKITMMPDITETLGAALFYLFGRGTATDDPQRANSCDPADLEAAKNVLIAQKPHLATYAGTEEFQVGLQNEEFYISHGWNGDIGGIVYESSETEILLEKTLPKIKYTVPEEGGTAWFDNFAVPRGAPHPEAAHAFINFMLDPKIAAINTMSVKYPFPTGRDYVPSELRDDPMIFTPPELLASLVRTRPFTDEERARRTAVWTAVQAA